ncbi:Guanine nucleotide-binding protein G(I)/G(S)/G(T) subunit beta-2 [Carex littledalei]|uniref:Guanine nucleotide-binding protein G(I)/G(S)/G(T) subunit beta-2 n=1 Tax=Carex littledalei TaxID=544730 RepID=A0A833VG72_9POAL|nr:Guanine nucleotide-binding protein G(I)/G(S)/G(T) subunit beta-2 [Carex littledalei]
MEKSEKGKEVFASKIASRIVRSFTNVLGTQSKIPKSELPQDPTNTTSITSSSATNTNAGASSSNTSQELTLFSRTRFGAGTQTNAGASSSNTSQEPQINESTSDAGASGDSGAGDIGVDDAGTAGGANTDDHQLAPSYSLIGTIYQETGYIRSMAAGLNGVLFTGSDSKLVREWHKGHPFARFKSSSGPVYAIVLQYPECRMFCAHNGGIIWVWESNIISQGMFRPTRMLQKLRDRLKNSILLRRAVSCLCLSDDGNFIYSGSVDHTVNVWHIRDWELVETIRNHEGAINALAVGPGVVFSGSSDGTIKMWKRELYGEKGDKVRHLLRGLFIISKKVMVNAVAFGTVSSSSELLYVGSSDGEVRCWRLFKDKPEVMSFHKGAVNCLALCSGPFVFSGSADMTICVWRRENEGAFHTRAMVLRGHSGPVHCIATQEDWEEDATGADRWVLYSGSLDRMLKIWRVYDRPLPKQSPPIIQHLEEVFPKKKFQEKVELRRIKSF